VKRVTVRTRWAAANSASSLNASGRRARMARLCSASSTEDRYWRIPASSGEDGGHSNRDPCVGRSLGRGGARIRFDRMERRPGSQEGASCGVVQLVHAAVKGASRPIDGPLVSDARRPASTFEPAGGPPHYSLRLPAGRGGWRIAGVSSTLPEPRTRPDPRRPSRPTGKPTTSRSPRTNGSSTRTRG
jgi:hypothetical protein